MFVKCYVVLFYSEKKLGNLEYCQKKEKFLLTINYTLVYLLNNKRKLEGEII